MRETLIGSALTAKIARWATNCSKWLAKVIGATITPSRREVLLEARGKTRYNDRHPDEYRPANHPLLLKLDGRPIGTTRLDDFGNGAGAVRLVAIIADLQMQGHDPKLAELVENYARRLDMTRLFVNAAPEARQSAAVEETTQEDVARVYATNVFGLLKPHMRLRRSGHIINISRAVATTASPRRALPV